MFYLRHEWRLLLPQSGKIDTFKERMGFYLLGSISSQSVLGIAAETTNEVLCVSRETRLGWNIQR